MPEAEQVQTRRARQQGTSGPRDAQQEEPENAQGVSDGRNTTAMVVPWRFGKERHWESCRKTAGRLKSSPRLVNLGACLVDGQVQFAALES
jgi:hypothetical protein